MNADLRTFVLVVERGSFSLAAAELGLTPSAVSKLVSRLEDRLEVRLLHRTTRRLSLTPEGDIFHLRARDILAAIEDAEAEVSQAGRMPRGRLRINCVTGFAFHELANALPVFSARYPDMHIELAVTDRVVDLLAENADIGIRSGAILDPSLVARKIADFERRLYAAPAYLAKRGMPGTPGDLAAHDCIVHASKPPYRWPFLVNGGLVDVDVAARLAVDNAETALRIAVAGGGITRVADLLVGESVRSGCLVPVLDDFHVVDPIPLFAVYPQGRHRMPKVRVFLDFMLERFSHGPWRSGVAVGGDPGRQ
ncbi:LysR family transcriptional regulator [Castellaniella sp. GW247-6E4]|uniref:LysR family transcriptional regulator n=1 Tax=Castellaniella sp. GW247-6E4 TaxID=3140380 RepID=UPI00331512CA